jgi:uncharacterized protein (UPF0276 family)
LGEGDIQYLKDGQERIEKALGELTKAVNDFRVMVAEKYVKKDEYADHLKAEEVRVVAIHKKIDGHAKEVSDKIDTHAKEVNDKIQDHEKEDRANKWKIFGAAMTVATFVFGIIQLVVSMVKNIPTKG